MSIHIEKEVRKMLQSTADASGHTIGDVDCNTYWGWLEITIKGNEVSANKYLEFETSIKAILEKGEYKWKMIACKKTEGGLFIKFINDREFGYAGPVLGAYHLG